MYLKNNYLNLKYYINLIVLIHIFHFNFELIIIKNEGKNS